MNKVKVPLVCIVIVSWNGGEKVWKCIGSLIEKTSYKNYKIILVDNGSTDGSIERIEKKFKKVIILRIGKNLGFTGGTIFGWNYCFKNYHPNYICDMNNDIITVQTNWLDLMVNVLEKNKKAGICGNKLLSPDNTLQLLYLGRPLKEKELDKGQYDFIKEVQAVGGANMLIKRKMIDKLGALDENFFYGPDDIDYCFRARRAGFKIIYNGFSKSVHLGSFSYFSVSRDFIYKPQSYGQMLFSFRHDGLIDGLKMSGRQLLRAFMTRKNPYSKIDYYNIYFHRNFVKRLGVFFFSFLSALNNYKNIKSSFKLTQDDRT